ncbi:MAG: hypothetical protein RLZZ225_716 [Pseudomonadota bacterium]|jgi:hypothetical protein
MFKVAFENRLPVQLSSESSWIKQDHKKHFEGVTAKSRQVLRTIPVASFKWERLLVSLYLKVLDKISDKIHKEFYLLKSFDLLITMVVYINEMDIKQWDVLLAELDKKHWTDEEKSKLTDKKKLKKSLANPKFVAKYLNLLLYKADFIFRLISLVNAPLVDPLLNYLYGADESFHIYYRNDEEFYAKYAFLNSLAFTDRFILWPIFLAIVKNFSHGINFNTLYFDESTHQQINCCIEKFLNNQYLIEIDTDMPIKRNIDCLLKYQTSLRDLVITCLGNDKNKISEKLDIILAIRALHSDQNKEILSFVFYAAVKALILTGNQSDLNKLFYAFIESGIPAEILVGDKLYNNILQESNRLDEENEDEEYEGCNLRGLALENINPVGLLKQVNLSAENQVELLDWIWQHFFSQLNEQERFDLLVPNLLAYNLLPSMALERNNIALLNWYQTKLETLKSYFEPGLDYQDVFIDKMHKAWMLSRDYGAGPYAGISHYEESRFAFNIPEENTAADLFYWFKNNFEHKKSFKLRELLFELSIRNREKDSFDNAFDNLVSFSDIKDVTKSYAFSRLMAVAVIKNDKEILDLFWNKILNIQDKKLQDTLKKRALVDSTWAFQETIKEGNMELMDWILSRVSSLTEQEKLFHLTCKWNLLYGLDSFRFEKTREQHSEPVGPEFNAIFSGKIELLNKIYAETASLIAKLDKCDQTSEHYQVISTPMLKKPNSKLNLVPERDQDLDSKLRIASMLTRLKQDYFDKNNLAHLAYIPILYNNKDYIYQINESELFTQAEKERFMASAFRVAVRCNNSEMLTVVWKQMEKNRPSISDQVLFLAATEAPRFYFAKLFTSLLKFCNTIQDSNRLVEKFENLAINFPIPELIPNLKISILAAKTFHEEAKEKHKRICTWLNQHPQPDKFTLAANFDSDADIVTEPEVKRRCSKRASRGCL